MNVKYKKTPDSKILRNIGNGSYGEVYLDDTGKAIKMFRQDDIFSECSTCNIFGKSTCKKCIEYENDQSLYFDYTFFCETSIITTMSGCKFVPQVTEIYYGNKAGFAMDYFSCSISDLLKSETQQHQITPEITQYIITQIVIALATAQQYLILHRDVKPQNIMINKDCKVCLVDWGLAASVYNDNIQNDTREVQTIWYRCPEHVLEVELNNPTIDMWSVGIILLELFRGKQGLISARSREEAMEKIIYYFGFPSANKKMLKKSKNFSSTQREENIFISCENNGMSPTCLDFLKKCVDLNPMTRMTPQQALTHPYINNCINNRIDTYIPISPNVKLEKLGSYYPTMINSHYSKIRSRYVEAFQEICKYGDNYDVTELALMLMYTDVLSSKSIFDMELKMEEILIAVSQIVGALTRGDSITMNMYKEIFHNKSLDYNKFNEKNLKLEVHHMLNIIIENLTFPLAMCTYVTMGYYVKCVSNELHTIYMKICKHVAENQLVNHFSNEEMYISILKCIASYNCNDESIIDKISILCNKFDFATQKLFDVCIVPSLACVQCGNTIFSIN